mmetsp:Transcript_77920/g.154789  ORF Transcript_77920/g.154789 Transcript_77920/m.154789 type:complete len:132 (+) Transcript_77920:1842-2237(+)
MKNTLGDEKLKDKISEDDKSKAEKAIDDALSWLESNQLAEKEEFEHKQKEVEGICSPIMQSMYSQGGGMGGMPGGMVRASLSLYPSRRLSIPIAASLCLPLPRIDSLPQPGGMPGADAGGAPGGPNIEEVD